MTIFINIPRVTMTVFLKKESNYDEPDPEFDADPMPYVDPFDSDPISDIERLIVSESDEERASDVG
jgi:hypothetical protein